MLDEKKVKVNASLIFQFMEGIEKPKEIQILNSKKEIKSNLQEIEFELIDFSINEYKVYECLFFFEYRKKKHSISVYYNRINYYLCGSGDFSIEIIFCDFIYKQINIKDCFIQYKNKKYEPKENFDLSTRKRINLLGIDITKLKLPKSLDDKDVQIKKEFGNNLLITITVSNSPKIIGIYQNEPFIEPIIIIRNELISELKAFIEKASKPLNYKKEKEYLQYLDDIDMINITQYYNAIKDSYEFEKKLVDNFNFYKEHLNDLEIELYSEFMILFPDIDAKERNTDKINLEQYRQQYYFSKSAILNFCSMIPEYVSKSDKIKLKYAACRILRKLLYNGKGLYVQELFNFIDFNMKDTIYYEANEFNKEFVELLKEKSEIFLFLLQINSGSGFNLLTGKNTAKLSMLNENDVKTHLNSIIQNYGIKMNYVGCFNAYTVNEVRITCINESSALHLSLDKKITLKDDPVYNKRYILANLLQREEFGHSFYNHRVEKENKLDPTSPIEFYNAIIKEKFIEIAKKAGESGVALSMFLTRGDINLMILLKSDSINFTELFHKPSLLTEEDLSEFINKLRSIHPNVFNFDQNDINLKIKYEDPYLNQGIPLGFPTKEKID